jgi:hypothetical protein
MKETFEYPERLDPKGRRIINEKCTCGHLRTQHDARFDLGHGECTACFCGQFSWIGFVFAKRARRKKVTR